MLRALLIALAVFAAALCGYLYWLHRSRAYIHVRSLTAAPAHRAVQPETRILRVEGCDRTFLVKVGELVEPQFAPSATPDALTRATGIYGPPVRHRHPSALVWAQDAFTLTEPLTGAAAGSLKLTLNTGHVVQTLDDVELGIDSFNAIRAKMRDRNLAVSDQLIHGQHSWTYRLTIPSSCGAKWQSTYSRTLPETPDLDAQIYPPAHSPDPSPRAAAFFNKLATEYSLERAHGPMH
jgi:hypothetical protein